MKPLLSIVIPTRNWPSELRVAIKSAIEIQSKVETEIIVASNGDSLKGDLQGIEPDLILKTRVVRSDERLSLTQNWKFGLGFSRGTWVHFLGFDDFLISDNGVNLRTLLTLTKTNGIKFKIAHFNWVENSPGGFVAPLSPTTHEIKSEVVSSQLSEKW